MNRVHIVSFLFSTVLILFLAGCKTVDEKKSAENFLQEHIHWLSDAERGGRLAGSPGEADAANYIADLFLQFGVEPAGDDGTYFQQFTLTGPIPQVMEKENYLSRNVVGRIEGSEYSDRYIILGAHFDGQGEGGMISMDHDGEPAIHPSADDNASGTAGLLHFASHFTENPARHSILLLAFSGEELGLLGSRHFVSEMEFPKDSVLAMINMDMIGRMTDGEINIFGTGTANVWDEILDTSANDTLNITTSPGGMGSSDHASFYEAGIPVLHYFTGTHEDYHRPTDTAEKINYSGMVLVLNHISDTINRLDEMEISEIEFVESTDQRSSPMRFNGVTLGVIPDYNYSGSGMRIESVRAGETADRNGFEDGDIIIKMGDDEISDIFAYMEALSDLQTGDSVNILLLRNGRELELTVEF
jgi:hypothetical protein